MVLRLASTSSTRWQLIPSGTAVPPCRSSCSSKESGSQLLQYSSGFVRSGECLAELEGGLKAFLGAGHVAVFLLGEAIVVLDDRIVEELLGCLFEQRCSPQIRVLLVVDPAKGIRNTGVLRLLLARGLGVVQGDVNIATLLAENPGQIVGGWGELGIERSEERRVGKECRSRWSP